MRANVLPNETYYYFSLDKDITKEHEKVMEVVKEYLSKKSSAESDELAQMFQDIEKYRNFVCRFDDYKEVTRFGVEGKRVAYGAFRHSAIEHEPQTVWTYTYEILHTGDQYYMTLDTWGDLPSNNLRTKVGKLLE